MSYGLCLTLNSIIENRDICRNKLMEKYDIHIYEYYLFLLEKISVKLCANAS
jgi:hypothetical protein